MLSTHMVSLSSEASTYCEPPSSTPFTAMLQSCVVLLWKMVPLSLLRTRQNPGCGLLGGFNLYVPIFSCKPLNFNIALMEDSAQNGAPSLQMQNGFEASVQCVLKIMFINRGVNIDVTPSWKLNIRCCYAAALLTQLFNMQFLLGANQLNPLLNDRNLPVLLVSWLKQGGSHVATSTQNSSQSSGKPWRCLGHGRSRLKSHGCCPRPKLSICT